MAPPSSKMVLDPNLDGESKFLIQHYFWARVCFIVKHYLFWDLWKKNLHGIIYCNDK